MNRFLQRVGPFLPGVRVAGVVLLLAAAFTLFASHFVRHATSFNSDQLYCVHFCDDLLHGRSVQGFHVPAAPYVFPDMVLLLGCLAVTSDLIAVFVLYAALYYSFLLGTLFALNRGIGCGRRESFMIAALSVTFLLASHLHPVYTTHNLLMFHPGNHMGCLSIGLGVVAFVLRALRDGCGWLSSELFVAVCVVSGFSDQLLIVQFFVPVSAALLLLGLCRHIPRRRAVLLLVLLGVSTFLVFKMRVLVGWLGLVPMRIANLDSGVGANVPQAFAEFAASWRGIAADQPLMWITLAIYVVAAVAVVALRVRRFEPARSDAPATDIGAPPSESRLNNPAVLFVALVLLFALLSNAGALIVTDTASAAAVHRYLYTWWILPFLCLLLWPRLFSGRAARWTRWAAVAFVAFRLVGSADLLTAESFPHRYTPLAQALDKMVREHGPMRGFAEYWRARESRYLTQEHVPVLPILSSGIPWFHGFNPNSYLAENPRDLSVPDYQFVVFPTGDEVGPDREQIQARYGKPDEIIALDGYEIWRYQQMNSRPLDQFLRAQLAQRLVREKPFAVPSQPACLRKPRRNLSPWTAPGNLLIKRGDPVTVRFDKPATGAMIDICAHFGDEYILSFSRGGKELGTTRVHAVDWTGSDNGYCPPGMQSRLVPVPAACRPEGFDEVRIMPVGRDEWCVLGHFLVFEEWIPCKPAVNRTTDRPQRYEGETLNNPGSAEVTTIADPAASAGRARQASAAFQDCMAYGPYLPLSPGRYRVEFALRVADNQSADAVATIDCVAFGGQQVLVSRPLHGDEFASAEQFSRFRITFDTEEELDLVEYRVSVHGKTKVTLDCIDVTRLGDSKTTARR